MGHFSDRRDFAIAVCKEAGVRAVEYFADRSALVVDQKGAQDWVSEADRNVETFIRQRIAAAWPEDGIFGEEHAATAGKSGFDWVIDPIDGTTNFVNGIPAWTIVLAGVSQGQTQVGVIHDPNVDETYVAIRGGGSTLNGSGMQVASGVALEDGTVAVGYSNRVETRNVLPIVADLVARGAMFHRNASGALSLAYVAAGRLLGYVEEHMNAWDCLAGQLLIAEAGGRIEEQDADKMIRDGGRVIVGTPDVFETLLTIAEGAWTGGPRSGD
ncbi:MAG: inositol monophosphatase [Litoreibacter sp.]|nr:inositol monophosphatase [Litoreibacter sp.]